MHIELTQCYPFKSISNRFGIELSIGKISSHLRKSASNGFGNELASQSRSENLSAPSAKKQWRSASPSALLWARPRPPALPTTSPEAAPSCRPPWKPWPELELPPPWAPMTWCRQPWPPRHPHAAPGPTCRIPPPAGPCSSELRSAEPCSPAPLLLLPCSSGR